MIDTKKLNTNLETENFKTIKSYFTIDIDNLNWCDIILIYARLFAYFLQDNVTMYKRELEYNNLFRISYSTSRNGVHIKANIENNLRENLYYRALFNDDILRLKSDWLRLNNSVLNYDVAFKLKRVKGVIGQKDFKLINVLDKLGMSKKTFYLLIKYVRLKNSKKVSIVLNNYKHNRFRKYDVTGNQDKFTDFTETELAKFNRLLLKYSNKDKSTNLKNNYATEKPIELCKAIYRMTKFGL